MQRQREEVQRLTPSPMGSGRRAFLKWVAAAGGVVSVLLAGVPALRAFLSPVFRRGGREKWIRLGNAGQFALDEPVKVDFVESADDAWIETRRLRNVWVYTPDGETFTVYSGRCTHLGCNYAFDTEARVFRCPCHAGYFAVDSGTVLGGPPPRPLDALRVKVEDGVLFADYQEFRLGIPEKLTT